MRPLLVLLFAAALAAPAWAQEAEPPPETNPPMTGPRLLIATSMGDITLQLDAARAPKSVANVLRYVKEKHYDGTVVYRAVKGFIIQLGSWEAHNKPRGVYPGKLPLEDHNGLRNLKGAAALAHDEDPESGNADFFIDLADNPSLDTPESGSPRGYAVFGQVVSGMDVAERIGAVPVGDDGPMPGQAPLDPVTVYNISVLTD
jgi:cyclophilin family peptidyl-prolyl cis-trans isomerase